MNDAANINLSTSRFRITVGIIIGLIVVVSVVLFVSWRLAAIFHLYQIDLRRDAILLLTVRDLSLAVLVLCGGYVLSSLVCNWGKAGRLVAVYILILSAVSFGFSTYLEQRLRSSVQDNLEQFRRAVQNHELNQQRGGSSIP